jgi:hypothetical protein
MATADVVELRLETLEKFQDRATPIFEDMRRSLEQLVLQGREYSRVHGDFEQRLRLLEAEVTAAGVIGRLSHPIFVSLVSSALGAGLMYLFRR